MIRTGNKFILIPALFIVLSISYAFAQNLQSKPTRQSALDAFSKGNYELAYNQFNELSTSYPRDPLYKYYCGVSLVKLEREPDKASTLLKEAQQGSAAIRTIPSDALFYLGRAQQLSGNFSEAVKSYNLYTEQAGKKTARETLTPQFIQQCNDRKGEIVLAEKFKIEVIIKDSVPSDSLSARKEPIPVVIQKVSGVTKETLVEKKAEKPQNNNAQKANNKAFKDTVNKVVIKEKILTTQPKPVEFYSAFEVVAKPVYAANEKVSVNPEVPAGLIYRIQLAVFRNPVAPSYFKGITPVYGFKNVGSDVTIYYAGMFRKYADALKALVKVKAAGFKDAFVVAIMDKKIISAERAGILEKEWGKRPFITVQKNQDTLRDTIPLTLVFRVEAKKSQKPLNTEQLTIIKRLAGSRGLDIIKNESGQNIYLIGKFLTFESAAEYADLLTRNGQKEARVTAYLGRREIPVETAKQLFEKF